MTLDPADPAYAELLAAIDEGCSDHEGFPFESSDPEAVLRHILPVLDPNDGEHVVVASDNGWIMEHSLACRLSGKMAECRWHRAMDDYFPEGVRHQGRYAVELYGPSGEPPIALRKLETP